LSIVLVKVVVVLIHNVVVPLVVVISAVGIQLTTETGNLQLLLRQRCGVDGGHLHDLLAAAATAAAANGQGTGSAAPAALSAECRGPAWNPGNVPTTTNASQGAVFDLEMTGEGGGGETSWDGGVRVGSNDKEYIIIMVNVTRGINQRWAKLQKEMCVNSFLSIFVSLVRKAAYDFF
jgi:hypothetical protein